MKKNFFDPPIFLSGGDLFGGTDGEEDDKEKFDGPKYDIKSYTLVETLEQVKIREFDFHSTNANFVWPGTKIMAQFVHENLETIFGADKKVIELGRFEYFLIS